MGRAVVEDEAWTAATAHTASHSGAGQSLVRRACSKGSVNCCTSAHPPVDGRDTARVVSCRWLRITCQGSQSNPSSCPGLRSTDCLSCTALTGLNLPFHIPDTRISLPRVASNYLTVSSRARPPAQRYILPKERTGAAAAGTSSLASAPSRGSARQQSRSGHTPPTPHSCEPASTSPCFLSPIVCVRRRRKGLFAPPKTTSHARPFHLPLAQTRPPLSAIP